MKYKFLLLTSLLVLIILSCKNIEQDTSLAETTTVSFAADNTRSIYTKLSNSNYTYTIKGKAKSGATFQTDRHYTYNELSYTRFEIQKGTWDFTMNVFTGEEVISTGTKSVTIDKSSVISIPLYAKTGSTASLSVKLNFPQDKDVAKITAALYDSVTEADAGSALTLEAGYVTYTNDYVPAGTSRILKFYLYDSQEVCIASYIESVYLAAHDNVTVERTLSNVNMFAATVSVKDANGNDLTDSGLLVKAVKGDKAYPMTAVSGTNMYTASLPLGTYDVYAGLIDTDIDLVVNFLQGGNATITFATKETLISAIAGLTEDSTIRMAGELTDSDLTVIADAIKNSTHNVNINLSLTTGLTSIPDSAFRECRNLSGIIIPDSVTSIGQGAFNGCSSLSSVTIPDSVTSIGYSVFSGCSYLSSVTIPDSVTSIGNYAFGACTALSSVTIPDSVTSIGYSAFNGCSSLSSVTIPDSVTSIGNFAFSGCSLSSVTIPDSVTSIGNFAFSGCTNLAAFTVDSNNATYSSIDGVLFNKDASTLINYPEGKQSAEYSIPESVTSIYDNAFAYCTALSSVTIPDSVTSIKQQAFCGCSYLSSVTIPDSVTSIGDGAFSDCLSLSSVTIPDSVTSIGSNTFCMCISLSSVTIPDSVTSIGSKAFEGCTNLSSVTIGDSVTSIGDLAFSGCSSLSSVTFNCPITSYITNGFFEQFVEDYYNITLYVNILNSVNIGDSVTSIDKNALINCSNLESINVDSNNANYSSIDGVLFNKDETTLILYPIGKQSAEYTIPDSITTIEDMAFYGCSSLSSVTIPDSVTSIGSKAFYHCTSLSSVTIPDSVTSIGSFAFKDCSKLASLTFTDPRIWFRTGFETEMEYKICGTLTNVSDAAANATYFKDTYDAYYWYKLDE